MKSKRVEPFNSPPFDWTRLTNSILPRFADPWNIMCSNRCANPVRSFGSLRNPMW